MLKLTKKYASTSLCKNHFTLKAPLLIKYNRQNLNYINAGLQWWLEKSVCLEKVSSCGSRSPPYLRTCFQNIIDNYIILCWHSHKDKKHNSWMFSARRVWNGLEAARSDKFSSNLEESCVRYIWKQGCWFTGRTSLHFNFKDYTFISHQSQQTFDN